MENNEIAPLVDWLTKDLPRGEQPQPTRGTLLRWEQEKKDRESGDYEFDSANVLSSEHKKHARFRQLWLLELETDAVDMEAAGNDGWPDNFLAPMGLKTSVVKGILSANGWTPLKGKLQTIRELKDAALA